MSGAPIGSFLSILPEDRAVAPIPRRPGWLRIGTPDGEVFLATETIVGVEVRRSVFGAIIGTWIQRRDGTTHCCGSLTAEAVLAAMDEADDEVPGALPPPVPYRADDLLARVVQRRDALARTLAPNEAGAEIPPTLGLLRDQALHIASNVSHPRDWLLLLRDAAFEAAAELVNGDSPLAADRFIALGRMLERDVRRLPAEAPRA